MRLTAFLWLASMGWSFGGSALLAAATVAPPWNAEQVALFHYAPPFSFGFGVVFTLLSLSEVWGRRSEVGQIKKEHRTWAEIRPIRSEPGTDAESKG